MRDESFDHLLSSAAESTVLAQYKLTREQFAKAKAYEDAEANENPSEKTVVPIKVEQPYLPGRLDHRRTPMFRQLSLFSLVLHGANCSEKDYKFSVAEESLLKQCRNADNFNKEIKAPTPLALRLIYQNIGGLVAYNQIQRALITELQKIAPDVMERTEIQDWLEFVHKSWSHTAQSFVELSDALRLRPNSPDEFVKRAKERVGYNKHHLIPTREKFRQETSADSEVKQRAGLVAFSQTTYRHSQQDNGKKKKKDQTNNQSQQQQNNKNKKGKGRRNNGRKRQKTNNYYDNYPRQQPNSHYQNPWPAQNPWQNQNSFQNQGQGKNGQKGKGRQNPRPRQ